MSDCSLLPNLYSALTLRERCRWLAASGQITAFDAPLAAKRLERWQAQRPFSHSPLLFQQRLAQDTLTTKTLAQILGQKDAAAMVGLPWWAEQLARAFDDPGAGPARPVDEAVEAGFLAALTPLITPARERVRDGLAALAARYPQQPANDAASLEATLYDGVRWVLERILRPTLALELNIAGLQGELPGPTPEARFVAYVERLRRPEGVRPLVAEYPVLFRLAATRLESWVSTSLEMVERLYADWEAIGATFFSGKELGRLLRIEAAQHNTKRGGRSVAVFAFDSGLKVVYKPRSLALEGHFQDVLTWLNACGQQPTFRTLAMLDRGTHGWVEWVDAAECASEAEVQRFYQRQGAYLALLYALEATDFHMSNVIAAGEHPMLIDLEALFHPRDAEPALPPLDLALERATYHSVLRLGLLPEPELARDETVGAFDQSGLAGAGGQRTPYTVPTWENKGTDTMRLVRKHKTIRGSGNLPVWLGRPVNVVDYQAAIDEGFTALYRFLMARRGQLLAPQSGLLARFAGDEVRVLPRSGRRYSVLLEQSFHPDLMRDALDRDRFLDRLWQGVESEPYLAELIPHEQVDLLVGDVPLFTTQAGSRAVYNSAGKSITDTFFPGSGLEAARQRIAALDKHDLARQRWFIKAALATMVTAPAATPAHAIAAPAAAPAGLRQQLLDQACAVGERLAQLALCADGEVSWIGVTLVKGRHWFVEPLGADLYNGLPGVALFLAYLGEVTGEERWTPLAKAATATLRRELAEARLERVDDLAPIGAFDGLGGQLFALAHLATLWREPALAGVIEAQVEAAALCLQQPANHEQAGLGRGVGGCLAGLLAVYRVMPTLRTLEVGRLAGDQLLRLIRATAPEDEANLPGPSEPFAYFWASQAGAAWTLLALAEATGEEHYGSMSSAILTAIPAPEVATPGHWLAALRARPWLVEPRQRRTLDTGLKVALPSLLERGLGRNHSLSGDLGYLDLWLQVSLTLNDNAWLHECARYAAAVIAQIQRYGRVTAVPLGVETPGLMAGLAGIGYGLLRLAAPERVPSVLALELPRSI